MTNPGAAAVSFGLGALAYFAMAIAASRPAHPATDEDLAMMTGRGITLTTQRGLDCGEGGLTQDLLDVADVVKARWPNAYQAGRVQGQQIIGTLDKLPLDVRCKRYRDLLTK